MRIVYRSQDETVRDEIDRCMEVIADREADGQPPPQELSMYLMGLRWAAYTLGTSRPPQRRAP